jgi:hypothetical protein
MDRAIPNHRCVLVGLACGVLIGLACWSDVAEKGNHPVAVLLWLILLWGSFGGLAGGSVSKVGWPTILGAMVGWIILGGLFSWVTGIGKAAIYAILPGGFFGGSYGYVLGARWKSSDSRSRKTSPPRGSDSLWDREVDG